LTVDVIRSAVHGRKAPTSTISEDRSAFELLLDRLAVC
jgi:hypothetical protein